MLFVTVTDAPTTRRIVQEARRLNPRLNIVVRTHSEEERGVLLDLEVDDVVLGEREVAAEMARYGLRRFGLAGAELQTIVQGLRLRGAEA